MRIRHAVRKTTSKQTQQNTIVIDAVHVADEGQTLSCDAIRALTIYEARHAEESEDKSYGESPDLESAVCSTTSDCNDFYNQSICVNKTFQLSE